MINLQPIVRAPSPHAGVTEDPRDHGSPPRRVRRLDPMRVEQPPMYPFEATQAIAEDDETVDQIIQRLEAGSAKHTLSGLGVLSAEPPFTTPRRVAPKDTGRERNRWYTPPRRAYFPESQVVEYNHDKKWNSAAPEPPLFDSDGDEEPTVVRKALAAPRVGPFRPHLTHVSATQSPPPKRPYGAPAPDVDSRDLTPTQETFSREATVWPAMDGDEGVVEDFGRQESTVF